MVSIGDTYEAKTIENLVRTADYGYTYGIPTMGVTAVGKQMTRDARYFATAARICAENGAPFAKEMQIAFTIIGFFAADVNNYKSFPSYKFCPETMISS
jgi:DhnA family fructose-bisphosphate aldolase class Ia